MILQRCFAWSRRAQPDEQDGPLWVPRAFQGDARHDNPDLYGCLYLADREIAAIELDDEAEILDLDDPRVLVRERLRPSAVATRQREVTQPQARALHLARPRVAALRWWSTFEAP